MAILGGPPGRGKTAAHRGRFYVRQWRGRLVLSAWPRKRGRNIHPKVKQLNDDFKKANWLCKYLDARQIMTARNAVQGTPLMPRDLLVAAMYGRLWAISMEGGPTLFSKAMASDVSQNLDIIGQAPGDMLARGSEGWERIPGGNAGEVLVSQGPTVPAAWQSGGGGGGSKAMSVIPTAGNSTSAFATKGIFFTPLLQMTVHGLIADFDELSSATYVATLAQMSGSNLGAILAQSAPLTGVGGTGVRRYFPFPTPAVVNAGVEVALMLTRTDDGATYALPFQAPTINTPPAPVSHVLGYVRIATTAPAAGQAANRTVTTAIFTANWLYIV